MNMNTETQNEIAETRDLFGENEQKEEINRGTGAGGANTNYYGKKFEEKTDNQSRLLENGFTKTTINKKSKTGYYLSKTFDDKTIYFVHQNGLKTIMKHKYNIDMFRCPDAAYIFEYNTGKTLIKILEKKWQKDDGSVETKLWAAYSLRREYELVLGTKFEVVYGFCLSDYFKQEFISYKKKYEILDQILKEQKIEVLFGDDENYFETLDTWINNSV